MTVLGEMGRSGTLMRHRTLTCPAQGGCRPPVSGGIFDLLQMSQEEEDVLSLEDSDSEYFDTAEAGSSADEMDDCLFVVLEVERLAVAEATGPKISKVPAGAEASGSEEMIMNSPVYGFRHTQ